MVIVKFQGGIGNQLFEYAFYKELIYLGKEVYADFSSFNTDYQIREYELEKIGLFVKPAPKAMLRKMGQLHDTLFDKVMYRIKGRKCIISDEFGQFFNPYFFTVDNAVLDGYWQTKRYFEDVFDAVIGEIDYVSGLDEKNIAIAAEMGICNSVSVHMRFGDYVEHNLYSGICTPQYYMNALEYIKRNVDSPHFYIITDDEQKATEVLGNENYEILSNNRGNDSYKDLYLISQCKHHIMANSSFSWWGVMLDKRKEGIVISPSCWLNGVDTRDIWEDEWIKM